MRVLSNDARFKDGSLCRICKNRMGLTTRSGLPRIATLNAMKLTTVIELLVIALWSQFTYAESPPASFAYILQADAFAKTKSAAVGRLTTCGRDWIVLDAAFSSDTSWERADLDTIRSGYVGRKVIAYISIGEAEDYRPYWRKEWVSRGKLTAAAPAWLGAENPEWKGNYRVKYWQAAWQKLILASIDEAIAHGFDGVYLDIVDGFETFEQDGNQFLDGRVNPETRQSYRRDMVDWVKAISAHARARNPAALVIPQNGSQLVAHADSSKLSALSASKTCSPMATRSNPSRTRMKCSAI